MARKEKLKRQLKKTMRVVFFVFSPLCLFALPAHLATTLSKQDFASRKKKIAAWILSLVTALGLAGLFIWALAFAEWHNHVNALRTLIFSVGLLSTGLLLVNFVRLSRWYFVVLVVLLITGGSYYLYQNSPPFYYQMKIVFSLTVSDATRFAELITENDDIEDFVCDKECDNKLNTGISDCFEGDNAHEFKELCSKPVRFWGYGRKKDGGVLFDFSGTDKFMRNFSVSLKYFESPIELLENPCEGSFWKKPFGNCDVVLNKNWLLHYEWMFPINFSQEEFEIAVKDLDNGKTKQFVIWGQKITDISPLKSLKNIEDLEIISANIKDYSPLKKLKKLKWLSLEDSGVGGCFFKDLKQIESLVGLEYLFIEWPCVSDLSPIAQFKNLKALAVSSSDVTDLGPISSLIKLESIQIAGTEVSDLSALAGMQNLKEIGLSKVSSSELSKLATIKGLRKLNVVVEDELIISTISEFENLEELTIVSKDCSDLSPLNKLGKLTKLTIYDSCTRRTPVSTWANLSHLETLALFDHKDSNFEPLSNLANLKDLAIFDTEFTPDDLKPLLKLKNLKLLRTDRRQGLKKLFEGTDVQISRERPDY